jgi:Zn-dependent protease with chaperone function
VSLSTLFSTHPSLDKRLAQLAKIEAELGKPS